MKGCAKMKKSISLLLCIIMLICSFAMPSFALTYNGFSYEIQDEKVIITGYSGSSKNLTIPTQIDGKYVIKIENNAFKDNKNLISVTISEGIEDIGDSAFENCTNLSTITLPVTITHIGKNAIYNTAYYNDESNWKLKRKIEDVDINIGSGTQETISWEDILAPTLQYLYLGTALIECQYSGTYKVKKGTTIIADYAFKNSEDATNIQFPQSLIAIGKHSFDGCISLGNFEVAENVKIDATSFYNTEFYNNSDNWEKGALYLDTRLITTDSDEIIIKKGTTQIVSGAINGKNVVIPESVTEICENAFANAKNSIIFGYEDTVAQAYANENNIKFVNLENITKGDVNFNGKLDADDYKILCDISILEQTPSFTVTLAGDMNEDGTVDGLDVIILDLFINNIGPSTIKGDADGNGEVNDDDYILLIEIVTLNAEITDIYMFDRCDLNYDGAVDSFDALYLDLALNGLTAIV